LELGPADLVFVAGSTMEGEEVAALAAFRVARLQHPGLRLILVPRQPDRFEKVGAWLEQQGEAVLRRSCPNLTPRVLEKRPILLVDTLGELSAVWGLADVAFVGGSLIPGRGGQNMMEPAAYGASVLFGPYTSNFKETVEQLLQRGGARRVANAEELTTALLEDLNDPETAARRGAAGRAYVLAQNGAAGRILAELDRLVDVEPEKSA
jgi:3-deoxy-D-manno-octulosonic-acid transferase